MSTQRIVLIVVFVMGIFLWLLALLGAGLVAYSPWLGFFACLVLGVAVFAPVK